ncbi:MAG: amino acid permease [Colwellia sp.]|nr:amino acid permease [Colwellia sp.]
MGVPELIAIALGRMVGGGIFTVLGISVAMIGTYTPVAFALGGMLAALAAYSYVKLGVYYKEEGASYSFMKRVFPNRPFAASVIGWWVVFGYTSTIALYAYTFSSYALSGFGGHQEEWLRKLIAGLVIAFFTGINLWSVKGMGKIEDLLVYTKLVILIVISFTLINHGEYSLPDLLENTGSNNNFLAILIITSLTFVAYEGFQLVINATNEIEQPEQNIPKAIYSAVFLATLIYVVIALGAILAIPMNEIIDKKEYALAAGANGVLGHWGTDLVVLGALLATSSAISGTLFGASRQVAAIAKDGYLPKVLSTRKKSIPTNAIIVMSVLSFFLIITGDLGLILEFGSITFLLVSLLIAIANFKVRDNTKSNTSLCLASILGLSTGTGLIIYYQANNHIEQLYFVIAIYSALTCASFIYSKRLFLK